MWRDLPGAYPGSYTGRGYNEYEAIATGHEYLDRGATVAATSAALYPRIPFVDGLPDFGFGNLGLGLLGLTVALLLLKRVV